VAGREPVGKPVQARRRESVNPWLTVVGVVGDMRRQGVETEPIPQKIFEPLTQIRRGLETLLRPHVYRRPPGRWWDVPGGRPSRDKQTPIMR